LSPISLVNGDFAMTAEHNVGVLPPLEDERPALML